MFKDPKIRHPHFRKVPNGRLPCRVMGGKSEQEVSIDILSLIVELATDKRVGVPRKIAS